MKQNQTEEPLMKSRSYAAVLRTGFSLYLSNLGRIFRPTWVVAAIFALICGAAGTASQIYWPSLITRILQQIPNINADAANEYLALLGTIVGLTVLAVLAGIVFQAYGLAILRQHATQGTIPSHQKQLHWEGYMVWRNMKAALFNLLIIGALYCVIAVFVYYNRDMLTAPQDHIVPIVAVLVVLLLTGIALLPTIHTTMKYLLEPRTAFWPTLIHHYPTAVGRWGFIFVVVLVSTLVTGILGLIACLPSLIVSQANWEARIGMLKGDPLGMPDYIEALTFITSTVTAFIAAYIHLAVLFPWYYMYGAIETRAAEKQNAKQKYNV